MLAMLSLAKLADQPAYVSCVCSSLVELNVTT